MGEGKGWISIYRKIQDSWLWQEKPFDKAHAWIDLLLLANHKDKKALLGNELITVKRGSFITSQKKLMIRWGWGNTKLRNFLELLKEDMMIEYSGIKYTEIVILNYEMYQIDKRQDVSTDSEEQQIVDKLQKTHDFGGNMSCSQTVHNKNGEKQIGDSLAVSMDSEESQIVDKSVANRRQIENKSSANTNNNVNNANNYNNVNKSEDLSDKAIELCKYWEELKPNESISKHMAALKIFIHDYSYDWTKDAIKITAKNKNMFIPNYVEVILKDWQANGEPEIYKNNKYPKQDSKFNNFRGRDYSTEQVKDLENKLLGWDQEAK